MAPSGYRRTAPNAVRFGRTAGATISRVHSDQEAEHRRETWTAYAYLSTFAYLLYALGSLTPYLRDELRLSDAQAALHATAAALGMVSAGALADVVERRIGRRAAGRLASGLLAVAAALLALAPALPLTLLGGYLLGAGGGAILSTVNLILGHRGGPRAATLVLRANVWSIAVAFLAPMAIAWLATTMLGWRASLALPVVAIAILELRGGQTLEVASHAVPARLPAAFWLGWGFVVLSVAIEFSYVVWGSSVVQHRTGSSREVATAIGGMFLVGMLASRLVLATGLVRLGGPGRWIDGGLAVVAAGSVILWLSQAVPLSALGVVMAGLGTGVLYPLGIPAALAQARTSILAAGARMTLASGVAILLAPLLLGMVSDAVGVVAGWPLVVALCGAAFVFHHLTPLPPAPAPAGELPGTVLGHLPRRP